MINTLGIICAQIVGFCHRMVKMYAGLGLDASKCRMLLTITLLQLEIGDVVAVCV